MAVSADIATGRHRESRDALRRKKNDNMPHADGSITQALPQGTRVEGWTRYHQYFHKLNADMQV